MTALFEATHGYLAYLIAIVCTTLVGLGVQRLLGAPYARALRWLLAPAVGQAVLALGIGGAIAVNVARFGRVAPFLWLALAGLAAVGVADLVRPRDGLRATRDERRRIALCLALAALLPFVVLWPYLHDGLANHRGSGLWDGWSYVAVGQYYWDFGRSTGDRSLFHAYGVTFNQKRFVASGEVAFLASVLRPGDGQSGLALFQALGLFTTIAGCAAFATTRGVSLLTTLGYLVLCGASGWFANVVWANNCDHLLALAYMPALIVLVEVPAPLARVRGVASVLVAGLLYTYPEMAWVPLGGLLVWLLQRRRMRPADPVWPSLWRVALAVALLTLPYLAIMARFLFEQAMLSVARDVARPGEGMLAGVVDPAWAWSAIWALGSEHRVSAWPRAEMTAALLLVLAWLAGLRVLVRTRQHALIASALGILAIAAWFAIGDRYSYATYKILLSGWWLCAWTLVLGASDAVTRARLPASGLVRAPRIAIAVMLLIGLAAVPASTLARNEGIARVPPAYSIVRRVPMEQTRALQEIGPLVGTHAVGLFLTDIDATYWAFYYLRDRAVRLPVLRGYLNGRRVRQHLARVPLVPWRDVRYILTEGPAPLPGAPRFEPPASWTRVWGRGNLELWDTHGRPWVALVEAKTPNGFERLGERSFFWLGGGATRLTVIASQAGAISFEGDFRFGASLAPELRTPDALVTGRPVTIRDGRGQSHVAQVASGRQAITIDVAEGANTIELTPLDRVAVATQANGDPRPLLLGVLAPRLSFTTLNVPTDKQLDGRVGTR